MHDEHRTPLSTPHFVPGQTRKNLITPSRRQESELSLTGATRKISKEIKGNTIFPDARGKGYLQPIQHTKSPLVDDELQQLEINLDVYYLQFLKTEVENNAEIRAQSARNSKITKKRLKLNKLTRV